MNGSKASFLLSGRTEHLTGANNGGKDNHWKQKQNGTVKIIEQLSDKLSIVRLVVVFIYQC